MDKKTTVWAIKPKQQQTAGYNWSAAGGPLNASNKLSSTHSATPRMTPKQGEQMQCENVSSHSGDPNHPEKWVEQDLLSSINQCSALCLGWTQCKLGTPCQTRKGQKLELFSLLQRKGRLEKHTTVSHHHPADIRKWDGVRLFQRYPAEGQTEMASSCNERNSLLDTRENSSQWERKSPERLWDLHSWRHPKYNQRRPRMLHSNLGIDPAQSRKLD